MKVIIAGSRRLEAYKNHYPVWLVADAVCKSGFKITEVVCGGAKGIDMAGVTWALSMNPQIPVKPFMPLWDKYGKAGGPIRNQEVADYADALILIWNGTSRGSEDMLKRAKAKGLKIYEYIVQ